MSTDASKMGSPWWPAEGSHPVDGYTADDVYPEDRDYGEDGLHTILVEPSWGHRPWLARCVDCGWRHLSWTSEAASLHAHSHGVVCLSEWEWVCPWCDEFTVDERGGSRYALDQIGCHIAAEHGVDHATHPLRQAEAWRRKP